MPEPATVSRPAPARHSPAAPETIAVGISTYNRGPRITQTLAALVRSIRQTPRLTHIVVVDNNSTDDTAQAVDAFIAANRGVPISRVVEPAQGASEARRRVFKSTNEPLVCLMDDDCLPSPNWAQALLSLLDEQPNAGAVGPRIDLAWETGPTSIALRYQEFLAHQNFGPSRKVLNHPESGLVTAAMALRRRAIDESGWLAGARLAGRRPDSFASGEDTEMCILLRRAGWEIWYEPASVVGHLIPAERQTLDYLARLRHGISLTEPLLKWMAHGEPGLDWIEPYHDRARRQYLKTLLLEWRPRRRRMRLAERSARVQGWRHLLQELSQ